MVRSDDKEEMALGKFSRTFMLLALAGVAVAQGREPDVLLRVSSQDREVLCQALYERFVKDPAQQSRIADLIQLRQVALTAPIFRRDRRDNVNLMGVTAAPEGMAPSAMPSELARIVLSHDVTHDLRQSRTPTEANRLSQPAQVTSIAAHIPESTLRVNPKIAGLKCVPSEDGSRLQLELSFEQVDLEVPVQVGVTYNDPETQEQRFQELLIGAPVNGVPQPVSGIRARVRIANPKLVLSLAIPPTGTDVRASDLQILSTPSGVTAEVSVPKDLQFGVGLPGGGAISAKFSDELREKIASEAAAQAAQQVGNDLSREEVLTPVRDAVLREINPMISRAREQLRHEVSASEIPLRLGLRKALTELKAASEDFSPNVGRSNRATLASSDEVNTTRSMTVDAIARILGELRKVDTFEKYKSDAVQDQLKLAVELMGQYLRDQTLAQNLLGRDRAHTVRNRLQWLQRKFSADGAYRHEESQFRGDLSSVISILEELRGAIAVQGVVNPQALIASDFAESSARIQQLTRIHRQVAMARTFRFAVNEEETRLRGDQWMVGIDLLMNELNGGQLMLSGRGCNTTEPASPTSRSSSVSASLARVNSMLSNFYQDGTLQELVRAKELDLTVPLQLRGTHLSNRFEMDIGVKKAGALPIFSDFDFKGKLEIAMNPIDGGSGIKVEVTGLKDLDRQFDPRMILNPIDGVMSLVLGPLIKSVAQASFDEASGKMELILRSDELKRRGVQITRVYLDATHADRPEIKVDYSLTNPQTLLAPLPTGGGAP